MGNFELEKHPLADGGEGTVEAIIEAHDGEYRTTTVHGPLGEETEAKWGVYSSDEPTAVIEMAQASGYELIDSGENDPMGATTYGTGELIKEAIETGAERIYLGLGGSATVDGGLGMARALGFQFLDFDGDTVKTPGRMQEVQTLDDTGALRNLRETTFLACVDVDNPLLGEDGAAKVFAPQKGASPDEVQILEFSLENWAEVLENYAGKQLSQSSGTGAAGGLGFGLAALLQADLRSGAEAVMDETNFNSKLKSADILITGEGSMDRQTNMGKAPASAADRARKFELDYILGIGGQLSEGFENLYPLFDYIISCTRAPEDLNSVLRKVDKYLERGSRDLARLIKLLH